MFSSAGEVGPEGLRGVKWGWSELSKDPETPRV